MPLKVSFSTFLLMTIASSSLGFQPSSTPPALVTQSAFRNDNDIKNGKLLSQRGSHLRTTTSDTSPLPPKQQYHLVLVGGGHAHVQVIKALAKRPEYLKVTLIDQQTAATYSGMVPGCIAGLYEKSETQIAIQQLADSYSQIEFINDRVVDIDCNGKFLYLKHNSTPISFDVLSLDIGSTVRSLDDTDGAAEYTIPTRPIDKLVDRLRREMMSDDDRGIVVVGGGVAGIELSMATSSRYTKEKNQSRRYGVTLLDAGEELLPNESDTVRKNVVDLLEQKGIRVQHNCQVARIDKDTIYLKDGRTVPYRNCIWATGAGVHSLARKLKGTPEQLDCDKYGWFVVEPTLQSTSHPHIFAAGDCATIVDPDDPQAPSPPKAGVYAVRSGPILIENLTRYVEYLRQLDSGDKGIQPLKLEKLKPQDDFMKLLVCGDGCALGIRFGITIQGPWVFEMKDTIDRSFMDLFNVAKLPPPPEEFDGSYDTSQYDAADHELSELSAAEGSALLKRTDAKVDFKEAKKVIRRMGQDEAYRRHVLAEMESGVSLAMS